MGKKAEEWREIDWIDGLAGSYAISTNGRIKRLSYRHYDPSRKEVVLIEEERMLNPWDNGHGYLVVTLGVNGRRANFYIHRLVATAFIENPLMLPEVNHIDYNKGNNSADNLEWCDRTQNVLHSRKNMWHPRITNYQSDTTNVRVKRGRRYEVSVTYKRKQYYVGTYDSMEEAIMSRNNKYRELGLGEAVDGEKAII